VIYKGEKKEKRGKGKNSPLYSTRQEGSSSPLSGGCNQDVKKEETVENDFAPKGGKERKGKGGTGIIHLEKTCGTEYPLRGTAQKRVPTPRS